MTDPGTTSKTKLPPDGGYITKLLNQKAYWLTKDRHTGGTTKQPIWELPLGHLENIVAWLDGQVEYILDLLLEDQVKWMGPTTDPSLTAINHALSADFRRNWLHTTPLVSELDKAIAHKREEWAKTHPITIEPTGWMLKPIIALHLETTGLNIEKDRMVAFTLGTSTKPGEWESITQIVNPGMPISIGAANVHGILDWQVAAEGIPEHDAAVSLVKTFGRLVETPVVMFNARFGLTILDRAARRATGNGITPHYVLDPFIIDKEIDPYRKGKRTLTAMCEHYGVLDVEHREPDTYAKHAVRLLWREMTSHAAYEYFQGDLPSLVEMMDLQREAAADQAHGMANYQARQGKVPDVTDDWWPIAKLPVSKMEIHF